MNIVEKYGGTSVADLDKIRAIAQHVKEMKEAGHNVILVASAMGKTTNKLIEMATALGGHTNDREMDSLLSTGEQRTITLLAMAIDALGIPAISLPDINVVSLPAIIMHMRVLKILTSPIYKNTWTMERLWWWLVFKELPSMVKLRR